MSADKNPLLICDRGGSACRKRMRAAWSFEEVGLRPGRRPAPVLALPAGWVLERGRPVCANHKRAEGEEIHHAR